MELEKFLYVLVVLVCLCSNAHGIDVGPDFRSFSSAIKGGTLEANKEKVLYEHKTGQSGVITEQWFTGEVEAEAWILFIFPTCDRILAAHSYLRIACGIS